MKFKAMFEVVLLKVYKLFFYNSCYVLEVISINDKYIFEPKNIPKTQIVHCIWVTDDLTKIFNK